MKKLLFLFSLLFSFFFSTNAQNVFPATGNVGIGIATPLFPLDMRGQLNILDGPFANCQLHFYNNGTGGGEPTLDVIRTTSSGLSVFRLGSDATKWVVNTVGESRWYNGAGGWYPTIYSSGVERFKILSSGQHVWNGYGAGAYAGTPTKYLGVDASGNVVESAVSAAGANIYNSDGTLTGNRSLSGATYSLDLGTSASLLSGLHVNANDVVLGYAGGCARVLISGKIQQNFGPGIATTTSFTVGAVWGYVLLTAQLSSGAPVITLPAMNAGAIITIINLNRSTTFKWSLAAPVGTGSIIDVTGASVVTIGNGIWKVFYDGTTYYAYKSNS